jgi:hypothetical protein
MSRSQIKIISLRLLIIIGLSVWLSGCQVWKKAALIGGATTVAAAAGSVLSSGVLVPAVAGGLTASVMSVGVDIMESSKGEDIVTASNCAPDNFWTLLGSIFEIGGWLLILVIIIPMVLGWLLPGPLEKAKKRKK